MGAAAPPLKRARTGLQTAKDSKREYSGPIVNDVHQPNGNNKSLKVFECSFIKWHVSGITSVAATPSGRYVAVARSDGTVELRDGNTMWSTISILHPKEIHQENRITGMAFSNCGEYLFAACLLGIVDIFRLTPDGLTRHTTLRPGGGAIWDIAVKRGSRKDPHIAIASDDGCVRIITPDGSLTSSDSNNFLPSDPVHYEVMATEKGSARVLSVCWSPVSSESDPACIICGDDEGGIRWLNASNGLSFGRGNIPTTRGENVMVWTLQFANSGSEVICGDSRGLATVWSSTTNTMNAEIRIEGMRGAIWSSLSVPDKSEAEYVILGGAGGGIGGLKKGENDESWTPLRAVQLHTHDVRSMCRLSDGMILSGSEDSLMRTFSPTSLVTRKSIKWIRPYYECVGQPPIQFCRDSGVAVARIGRRVELWSFMEEANKPSLLLRMNVNSILGDLRSCAVSEDCCSIAISAAHSFKLYQIWNGDGEAVNSSSFGKVIPLKVNETAQTLVRGCVDMSFGDQFLACLTSCRRKVVFLAGDSYHVTSLDDFGVRGSFLSRISCSRDQVAVCDTRGNVFICQIEEDHRDNGIPPKWVQTFASGGATVNRITALSLSGSGKKLAMSTLSHRVVVLDIESGSRKEFELSRYCSTFAHSISFSNSEKSVLTSGPNFCVICNTDVDTKRKKKDLKRIAAKSIHVLPYKDSIIGASIVGPSRIAVVRRKWEQVLPSLPDAIPKKVYGT